MRVRPETPLPCAATPVQDSLRVSADLKRAWNQARPVAYVWLRSPDRPAATLNDGSPIGGTPLGEGATLPGFAVTQAVPGRRVRLTGRHRYSQYELILTLHAERDGTVLSALTYAKFPGLHGRIYRGLVSGSGAHRVLVPRLLCAVRRTGIKCLQWIVSADTLTRVRAWSPDLGCWGL